MKVEMPKKYLPYIQMLVDSGVYPDVRVALENVFERGLQETLEDLELEEEGFPAEPVIDRAFIHGPSIQVAVPSKDEYARDLEYISRCFDMPLSETAKTILLYGLCCHRSHLKGSALYDTDPHFRRRVTTMPHCPEEKVLVGAFPDLEAED